jgi:GWxTD domain-containing protein
MAGCKEIPGVERMMTEANRVVRVHHWCALFVFWLTVAFVPAAAQVETFGTKMEEKSDAIYMDAMTYAGPNPSLNTLDVFVQVGYSSLTFVKADDHYTASYELTIGIYDSSNSLVTEKSWTEEIKGVTFDESVSARRFSFTERLFTVRPGRYGLSVIVRDIESKVSRRLTRSILASDFSNQPFALSDIMLVSKMSVNNGKRTIVPLVGGNVGELADSFYCYFEAYNAANFDSVRLVATVLDKKNEEQLTRDTVEPVRPGKNELFFQINHSALGLGEYILYIKAYSATDSVRKRFAGVTNRAIAVRWRGVPRGIKDLDLAIEQLRYIAKDTEMDSLTEAPTPEEKQKRFFEFWKRKDPNPNTPRNEKMEEFYSRVEYANKHFSHYIDGWRTDMGMVFIIFGPPSAVDRHPYDMDAKPYEVWSYYELNHQFVFVDQTGFGDYRLLTPIWEVWRRPGE